MLQACLNGDRRKAEIPTVPISAEELASDAIAAVAAGAQELHVHPRDDDGLESLEASIIGRALHAIRTAAPATPVGVSTGAWIASSGVDRIAQIRAWVEKPEYASVNLIEADCFEVMDALTGIGVGIEAGVWSKEDARKLVDSPFRDRCLRVMLEMTSDDPDAAEREFRSALRILQDGQISAPVLLHGLGGSAWAMVCIAAEEGFDTRIGFEDVDYLPDGEPAPSNADLVREAAAIIHAAQSSRS